jgi:tetratricopeptide (TPR) repeat protein
MTKKKTSATGTNIIQVSNAATPEPIGPGARQLKTWGQAVRLFTERRFTEACELFRVVAGGPDTQIADKARSYLQVCERRIAKPELQFHTAEDHFNYGVERMNARDMESARFHLGRALGIEPEGDHILYTLALCCGLAGDGNGACENLKRAISLEPRNRILARQDPEFSALAMQFPALRALLGSDGI